MTHTPGPWQWRDRYNGLYSVATLNEILDYDDHEGMSLNFREYGSKEAHANARLIAAAPDLLQALISITNQLERVGDSRKDAPFIEAARAAIAKAEGK